MDRRTRAGAVAATLFAISAHAQQAQPLRVADLADLSLEQLANVTVTSASRREERLIDAPASIFVITAEDIRRSGATTLPELLRLAPNLQVVRGDTNQYVISARGGLFGTANKMLVLIDGRTVYTPLFAGVFWDAQNVMIEDLERIEVISGPGSTLWGTNAVNGVINIITKNAARTQGTLVAAGAGDAERGVSVRSGGALAGGGAYRAYAKYYERNSFALASGASAQDASDRWQAGFRMDWDRGAGSSTVQGDVYSANVDNLGGARDLSGGNVLGRWSTRLSGGSDLIAQAYYDRTERRHLGSFEEKRDTYEVQVQHDLRYGVRNELIWGAKYRVSDDHTVTTPVLGFVPADRALHLGSLFAQDERALAPNLRATLGLRAERNPYTGVEWLPNARLTWTPRPDQVVWSALTRSVRAPSRVDRDLVVPGSPPFVLTGGADFESEIADVVELGWRTRITRTGTVSLTAFHHRFRDLRTVEPNGSVFTVMNGGEGRTSGLEGWGDFILRPNWRVVGGFVVMDNRFDTKPGHLDISNDKLGNNPKRTANLRSLWNITPAHELDAMVRYSSALPNPAVPGYTVVDLRGGWRPSRSVEVSLIVNNLFDRRYSEFGSPAERAVFERTVLLRLTWTPP